jgi:hypothetical protein
MTHRPGSECPAEVDATARIARLEEEVAALKHWRDLALQFDNHRMAALWHLKKVLNDTSASDEASAFLENPPLAAHEVVAERDDLQEEVARLNDLVASQTCVFCNDSGELLTKVKTLQSGLADARDLNINAKTLIEQFMPNVGKCCGIDFLLLNETLIRLSQQSAQLVTPVCPKCQDTGEADSGGVQPWGEGISVPCDCQAQEAEITGQP